MAVDAIRIALLGIPSLIGAVIFVARPSDQRRR